MLYKWIDKYNINIYSFIKLVILKALLFLALPWIFYGLTYFMNKYLKFFHRFFFECNINFINLYADCEDNSLYSWNSVNRYEICNYIPVKTNSNYLLLK